MKALRVLEAITPSGVGGAEIFVSNICRLLPEMGAEVELFCPSGRRFIDYAAEREIRARSWKTHGKLDPVTVIRLARLLRTGRFDVIHTHLSTASLLGAFAARLAGVPSVAHVHGLNTATCFRYSTAVITVSNAVAKHLAGQGLRKDRIRVVHNGVDVSRFQPTDLDDAKDKFGYASYDPIVGVFGRLSPEKGQRVAIEALFLITREYPRARLLLAGAGKELEDLKMAAEALGLADRVEFPGFLPDSREMMSACNVVLIPSLKEGFGLAAVEAMALERPVVASAVGGLNEIVVPGETGFTVAPNDPQAIAQAVLRLIEDSGLARDMGRKGRLRVMERFDLRKQAESVLRILGSPAQSVSTSEIG